MKEFKKILFPVDLSESSPNLVPYVLTMAEKFGSEIHLLFVARVLDSFTSIYVPHPSIDKFENEVTEGAKKRIQEFKEEHFQAFPDTKAVVLSGDISEEILNYIKSEGVDLVIMGTHGRKGLEKVVFGSVAERVAKGSKAPVLLLNPYKMS
ncbi:MAG: universal stress protein [Desulfobacterales bacterium]|nr:universal stress protein [Desulfobacterales bacterium]